MYQADENGTLANQSVIYNGLGYKQENSVYGAGARNAGFIQTKSGSTLGTGPSLVCPKDNDGGKLSKFTVNDTTYGNGALDKKIGLLTIDEMALAGLAPYPIYVNNNYDENTITSYLRENANDWYWTLSPIGFDFNVATVWFARDVGALVGGRVDGSGALRPVVSLKSDVTISSGNGTKNSPFVIN